MEEWFQDAREFGRVLKAISPKELRRDWHWPATLAYSSVLQPIFLRQFRDIHLFSLSKQWLLRDGLVPLLWFFSSFPEPPKRWKSHLFIHYSWARFVPPLWRKWVGSFQIHVPQGQRVRKRKILLSGLLEEDICSLDALSKQLGVARRTIQDAMTAEDLENARVVTFFFRSTDDHPRNLIKKVDFRAQYLSRVREVFGSDMKVMSFNQLMKSTDLRNVIAIEFNERLEILDTFVPQFVLSRGGAVVGTLCEENPLSNSNSEYVPLSPYHGFHIQRELGDCPWDDRYIRFLQNVIRSHKVFRKYDSDDILQPWPRSLVSWARSWY